MVISMGADHFFRQGVGKLRTIVMKYSESVPDRVRKFLDFNDLKLRFND